MVLLIDGLVQLVCPDNLSSFFKKNPNLKNTASDFLKVPKEIVESSGLLYVYQREFAAVTPEDNIKIIGSDDATTCIIAVIQHTSGILALTHLDGANTEEAIRIIFYKISRLLKSPLEDGIILHLFGGYSDPKLHSFDLFKSIMNTIHNLSVRVNIGICCVGEMNTFQKENKISPIIYGIGVETKSGRIFPASFPDKGPEEVLRGTRTFCGSHDILDVYNNSSMQLEIGPFELSKFPSARYFLEQDDEFILQYLSTSPDVEPPDFVPRIREQLKFVMSIYSTPFSLIHPFPNSKPLCYKMDQSDGIWVKLNT